MNRIDPDELRTLGLTVIDDPYAGAVLRAMRLHIYVTTPYVVNVTAQMLRLRVDRTVYARFTMALQELYAEGYLDFEEYSPGLWVWCATEAGDMAAVQGDKIHLRLDRELPYNNRPSQCHQTSTES
jgi:hypothetical protein